MIGSLVRRRPVEARFGLDGYLSLLQESFKYGGLNYVTGGGYSTPTQEAPPTAFEGYVRQLYLTNGPIFACVAARQLVLAEARFKFRPLGAQRLFGSPALQVLDRPWTNGTTGELISRMEQDASLAGNSYWTVRRGQLKRMVPSKVTIVCGSYDQVDDPADVNDLDLEVIGYVYEYAPGRYETLLPVEVMHYSPLPDPMAAHRGMSWLTPVIREVQADSGATEFKQAFFRNAATPQVAVVFDKDVNAEKFKLFKGELEKRHAGAANAYRTMYLGGGADVKAIGANLKEIEFKATQGAGETRIASAAGVPPVIVGFSEGLEAATYSNYSQARRRFADGTLRPLWRIMAQSLESLVAVPSGSELWYDTTEVAFLREDEKDQAEINQIHALSIRQLTDAGFEPDAAIDAVVGNDPNLLKGRHSGLFSVQLQPPGSTLAPINPPTNGNDDA